MYSIRFDEEDFLYWTSFILESFHKIIPLSEEEIELLYDHICMRACQIRVNGEEARFFSPENEYLYARAEHHSRAFKKLWNMSSKDVTEYYRKVISE